MNLLDMLAGDPPQAIYKTDEEPLSIIPPLGNISDKGIDSNNGVHFVPTVLTAMQRDICEIIVQIMRHHLLSEVDARRNRASINSLLEATENSDVINQGTDSHDMIKVLFDQLSIASRHPSLLVDHLMPKKLLLSETNERLLNLSGNLKIFNEIIDGIINSIRFSDKFDVLNILVVAENVKELELIEGIIIGKQLQYKNLSSRKMYDDNRGIKIANVQKLTEHKHKKRRFSDKNPKDNSEPLCLYLITTQQLYNHYTPASLSESSAFNLIFSFDQNLDHESPSIELLRNVATMRPKTPILIPVPIMSIYHIISQTSKPVGEVGSLSMDRSLSPMHKWRLKVLQSYMVNRFNLFEQTVPSFYRENYLSMEELYDWLTTASGKPYPDFNLQKFSDMLNLNYTDEKLLKKLHTDYLEPLIPDDNEPQNYQYGQEVRNYKDFKYTLSVVLHERIAELERKRSKIANQKLSTFRKDESERQIEIDHDEDLIAESYREMKKLIEKANVAERISSRAVGETERIQKIQDDLITKRSTLIESVETATVEAVADQKSHIEELKKELSNVTVELEKLVNEVDETRSNYQQSSAEAAKVSGELSELQEKNIKLQQKLTGPGSRLLPSLFEDDNLHKIQSECKKFELENAFIENIFALKFDKIINERNTILDSSSGSSTRQVNRISRSATPM